MKSSLRSFGMMSSLLVVVVLFGVIVASAAEECDRCNFDGNDLSDCKDYGLIDNEILIGWNIGSQECLDTYQIKITSVDPTIICGSVNGFVNELRFGTSLDTAKLGLGVASDTPDGFYNDGPTLKDEIIIDGGTIDCEESESNCYNAMKIYFDKTFGGQQEMVDVCKQLSNKILNDKQLEQSTLRNRLCLENKDGQTIPSSCEPLWSQLLEQINTYPTKGCQGYAFGTQNTPIPGCDDDSSSSSSTTTKSTNGSSSSSAAVIVNPTIGNLYVMMTQFIIIVVGLVAL